MDKLQARHYEDLFMRLLKKGELLHTNNKKRIRIGLIFLALFTVAMIVIRWLTDSDRATFMMIWILGMFVACIYLVSVEYIDDSIQKTLEEVTERDAEFDDLIMNSGEVHEKLQERRQERHEQRQERREHRQEERQERIEEIHEKILEKRESIHGKRSAIQEQINESLRAKTHEPGSPGKPREVYCERAETGNEQKKMYEEFAKKLADLQGKASEGPAVTAVAKEEAEPENGAEGTKPGIDIGRYGDGDGQ